jgi:hypothetical protein
MQSKKWKRMRRERPGTFFFAGKPGTFSWLTCRSKTHVDRTAMISRKNQARSDPNNTKNHRAVSDQTISALSSHQIKRHIQYSGKKSCSISAGERRN